MCLQCVVKAKLVFEEQIVPGYWLFESTIVNEHWPLGYYGVVECNNPLFVYKQTDEKLSNSFGKWEMDVLESTGDIAMKPMDGYRFIRACRKAGYKPKKHGTDVFFWFCERVAKKREQNG